MGALMRATDWSQTPFGPVEAWPQSLRTAVSIMDGYEVAERLRTLAAPPLTIAVTGYGQDADRTRSEASGFAAHFVKPVDLEELRNTLERLFTPSSSSASA